MFVFVECMCLWSVCVCGVFVFVFVECMCL